MNETYNDDGLECPSCGKVDTDAWELGDGFEGCGETECGYCDKPIKWERIVSVAYKGSVVAANESSSATTRRWRGGCASCRRASFEAFAAALG